MASSDNLHSQQFHQDHLFDPGPVDAGYKPPTDTPSKAPETSSKSTSKGPRVIEGGRTSGLVYRKPDHSRIAGWAMGTPSSGKQVFPGARTYPPDSPYHTPFPKHGELISTRMNTAETHKQTHLGTKDDPDYNTYYHSSHHSDPPHLVDHEHAAHYDPKHGMSGRTGANDVLFAGTAAAAGMFNRPYTHKYRVPKSVESETIMADDDLESGVKSQHAVGHHKAAEAGYRDALYSAGDSPTLFESISARRTEVAGRKEVQRMRNDIEDRGNLSVIMPKAHMESLGVQYMGVNEKRGKRGYHDPSTMSPYSKSGKDPYNPKIVQPKVKTGKPAGNMTWDPGKQGPAFHETMPNAISTLEGKTSPAITPPASHKKPKQTKVAKPKDATFDLTGY